MDPEEIITNEDGLTLEEQVAVGDITQEAADKLKESAKEKEESETSEDEDKSKETEPAAKETESATGDKEEPEEEPEKRDKVQERIDRLTWEKKEIERKHNLLLQLGPQEYYKVYPDEAPADFKPQQQQPVQQPVDIGSMVVKGGQYDGMTLREVYSIDPVTATSMQNDYLWQQRIDGMQKAAKVNAETQAINGQINEFIKGQAKELFNKDDVSNLSEAEKIKIAETLNTVADWMRKTKRGGGNLSDAFYLMQKEGILKTERAKGAEAALKAITKEPVPSIGNMKGASDDDGFGKYMSMSDDQLADAIGDMTDTEADKFYKTAPKALQKKHPSLPWG